MFGNIGFMGIPIISSIYPENGMLYISVFTIVDQLALWTIGVKLTTPGEKGRERFNPWKLVNPATVAIILAVLCVLCRFHLPRLLNIALGKIGATATPMAMIYLGGVFGCINIRKYIVPVSYTHLDVYKRQVLDEPTSFLDIRHKLELLTILKNLVREKQVAVLMSLHELDLAEKLSDYIVCVKGDAIEPVSYTHLDVYKRQLLSRFWKMKKQRLFPWCILCITMDRN